MPKRKNHLLAADRHRHQPIQLVLRPALAKESVREDHDPKSAIGNPGIDLANPCAHDDIGQGGTCFLLLGGEQNVTITINDQTGQSVAALVSFFTNVYAYESNVCGTGTLDVPEGTNRMWVRPITDEGHFCASPAIPTVGTITAAFS